MRSRSRMSNRLNNLGNFDWYARVYVVYRHCLYTTYSVHSVRPSVCGIYTTYIRAYQTKLYSIHVYTIYIISLSQHYVFILYYASHALYFNVITIIQCKSPDFQQL